VRIGPPSGAPAERRIERGGEPMGVEALSRVARSNRAASPARHTDFIEPRPWPRPRPRPRLHPRAGGGGVFLGHQAARRNPRRGHRGAMPEWPGEGDCLAAVCPRPPQRYSRRRTVPLVEAPRKVWRHSALPLTSSSGKECGSIGLGSTRLLSRLVAEPAAPLRAPVSVAWSHRRTRVCRSRCRDGRLMRPTPQR